MARLNRLCPVGIPQHIIQRSNNRQVCFNGDEDMAAYVQSRMNFDAWGNHQNDNWSRGTPTISSMTKQGYTGHEQLDSHKLVHMQGRVYDPALGRFLSADLFVQSPHSTQSFNRYSYVSNNPLSRIDPTGYADVGYAGRSGPEPADGVDCTKNPSQCPGITHYNSCASGATCMTGGEADSYLRDLLAMQTFTFDAFMGIGNPQAPAPTPQQQLDGYEEKVGVTKGTDGVMEIEVMGERKSSQGKNGRGISLQNGSWVKVGEVIGEGTKRTFSLGYKIKIEGADDRSSLHVNNLAYELTFTEIGPDGKPLSGAYPIYQGQLSSGGFNSLSTDMVIQLYGPPGTKFDWTLQINRTPKSCDNCGSPMINVYDWSTK